MELGSTNTEIQTCVILFKTGYHSSALKTAKIYARACELQRGDPRRLAFLEAAEDKVTLQFFTDTLMRHCRFTTQ